MAPTATLQGATYSGGILTNNTASRFETFISKKRFEKIQNAQKTVYYLNLNSDNYPGPYVRALRNHLLSLKLTGDIKIILSPLMFN
jgi:hypothetical protein